MAVENYGVLKCRAIDSFLERNNSTPHFQVHCIDENEVHYRIVINVMSKRPPSELLYLLEGNFPTKHISSFIKNTGFTPLERGLDYVRDNFFSSSDMKALPYHLPGKNNDLLDLLDNNIKYAISHNSILYIFGSRFENKEVEDYIFRFRPLVGMHNIHMNQGNLQEYSLDDEVYKDGAIFIQSADKNSCRAIFLAFQSQSWHTDEEGHKLSPIKL